MKKKKQQQQELVNCDEGYDGYYNDVMPDDADEPDAKHSDKTVGLKIGAVVFGLILFVAAIIVIMTTF